MKLDEICHHFLILFCHFSIFSAAFIKISTDFVIFCTSSWNSDKISLKFGGKKVQISPNFIDFGGNDMKWNFIRAKFWTGFLLKLWNLSGAKAHKSCRSRKMLKNASFLAIVAVDTAENEPLKKLRWFFR